jgi:hypothetical protein
VLTEPPFLADNRTGARIAFDDCRAIGTVENAFTVLVHASMPLFCGNYTSLRIP